MSSTIIRMASLVIQIVASSFCLEKIPRIWVICKDKSVAFKIFQLGAKKFPDSVEFMLAYIKYMSHLNEDNNTRVLFERIISSNDLPKDGIE